MIELTNTEAQQAFAALKEIAKMEVGIDLAFKIRRLLRELSAQLNDVEDIRKDGLQRFAVKNEAGQLVPDKQGNAQFANGEDAQAFIAFSEELMSKTQSYETTLTRADLEGLPAIRPAWLFALGELLAEED